MSRCGPDEHVALIADDASGAVAASLAEALRRVHAMHGALEVLVPVMRGAPSQLRMLWKERTSEFGDESAAE
jgi:hypothetical protein